MWMYYYNTLELTLNSINKCLQNCLANDERMKLTIVEPV